MADQWRFPMGNSGDMGPHCQPCDVLTTEDCSGSDEEAEEEDAEQMNMPPYFVTAIKKRNFFSSWTRLVSVAEEAKNLTAVRKVYDAFLLQFPFSHLYWKKYADTVQKLGSPEEVEKIYNRAVEANPLSVMLWINYILYLNSRMDKNLPVSMEKIDGVFDYALRTAGMDFHSDELWNLSIEWEKKQGRLKNATALYDRLLSIPTKEYHVHFDRFKQFVSSYSPVEILPSEELEWIHLQIEKENDNDQVAAEDSAEDDIYDIPESDLHTFREHIVKSREAIYLLNEAEVKKRSEFERKVQCFSFSPTPLKMKYLEDWRNYLRFEMSQGQHERILALFERCLMTCSLFEEFWLAYAQYMERHSVDAARSIFERACRIHIPPKVTLNLQWGVFEEKHGHVEKARNILQKLEAERPGLAIVRMKRVSLEQRNGDLQEAERLLREAVQNYSGTDLASFYAVKLARFLLRLRKDSETARTVLTEALQKQPNNIRLHVCLLETEMSRDSPADLDDCVDQALKSDLDHVAKSYFSLGRLQYQEEFGSSITSLCSAYDKHQTLLKEQEDLLTKPEQKYKTETFAPTTSVSDSKESTVPAKIQSPLLPASVTATLTPKSDYNIREPTESNPNARKVLLPLPQPPRPYYNPQPYNARPPSWPYVRMPHYMVTPPRPSPPMYRPWHQTFPFGMQWDYPPF